MVGAVHRLKMSSLPYTMYTLEKRQHDQEIYPIAVRIFRTETRSSRNGRVSPQTVLSTGLDLPELWLARSVDILCGEDNLLGETLVGLEWFINRDRDWAPSKY